jgi:hypothetical protein
LPKWTDIWWETPMEGSVSSFLKAEWKVSDTGSAQCWASSSSSQIGIQFSNWHLKTSLAYALTNKSAIDLRIWEGHRFENTLKSDHGLK